MRGVPILAVLLVATSASAQTPPDGKRLYAENCALCHNDRGHATTLIAKRMGQANAVLETRPNPNREMIEFIVRHGVRSMPPLRRAELSNAELKALADYLTQPQNLRQGGAP